MRFECQAGCTTCCEQRGQVYLSEEDILRLAEFLKMETLEFEARYVYRTRYVRRLRTPRETPCIFLEQGGCSVHPAKPTQCRTFPFWPELLENRKEWKETARWCPGIGKGALVQIQVAQEQAEQMRAAHPRMYEE